MKAPIVKVSSLKLSSWSDSFCGQDRLFLGSYNDHWVMVHGKEPFPHGKVVLSYPFKKGRRKLIKGTIESTPVSYPTTGLYYEFFFRPSSVVQLQKVRELNEEMDKFYGLA
jgi:hypothetical protein